MGIVAAGEVQQNEIRKRIKHLAAAFPQDIDRIDLRYGEDWTGEPSVFLTVHMTRKANDATRFNKFMLEFPIELLKQIPLEELGVHAYPVFHRYRAT